MEGPKGNKHLAAALLAVQSDIPMLQKDKTQENHGYNYVSADGVISQTRPYFLKHGIQVRHGGRKVESLADMVETRRGKNNSPDYQVTVQRARVTVTTTVTHVETGESFEEANDLIAESNTGRPIDKAILGAETTIIGYNLRGLLNLPRFDSESEVCGRDDTDYDPNSIGREAAIALYAEFRRLSLSLAYVRRKLTNSEADAKALAGDLAKWPKSYLPRIQEGIDKASAAQASQRASITNLPKKEPASEANPPEIDSRGVVVDTSVSQLGPADDGSQVPLFNGKGRKPKPTAV